MSKIAVKLVNEKKEKTSKSYLRVKENPSKKYEYVINLKKTLVKKVDGEKFLIDMHYIPDRYILETSSYEKYLGSIFDKLKDTIEETTILEEIALSVVDDLCNELVPLWVRVNLSFISDDKSGGRFHNVTIEDKQPQWNNQALIAKI